MHLMHHEYAVEPAAIAEDWKTCRYLSELFGFDRGRLLSMYPKKWLSQAIQAASHLPEVEKKRVTEKLRRLKEQALVRSGREFDPSSGDWADNALRQHAVAPFRAIIAANGVAGQPDILTPDEVSETHRLFAVERSAKISREATALAAALEPLLSCSSRILLVDKYYNPFNPKYQRTLRELLKIANRPNVEFEIHYCEHPKSPEASAIERAAPTKFSNVIPVGMTIKLIRWRERSGGMNFHARYLLTDRGGVRIDAGFSSEGNHQATDVELLETPFTVNAISDLDRAEGPYEQVGAVLEINDHEATA